MEEDPNARMATVIEGQLLRLREGHEVAIYERKGEPYVAEFCDGYAQFMYAAVWFRLYGASVRYSRNLRAALQQAAPLSPEMLQAIERLHSVSEFREARTLAALRGIVGAVQRSRIRVMPRLRSCAVKSTTPSVKALR